MAAPAFIPVNPTAKVKAYESNDHVPETWQPDRPAELPGRQPTGRRLGFQGPDQGYGLMLANRMKPRLKLQAGENADDAARGCLNIALRRASSFGRAPTGHDVSMAYTMWGFLDANPPVELVAARRLVFAELRKAAHHYEAGRAVVDSIPEPTIRMTPAELAAAYPGSWRDILGI